jgi:hypothetical protein
MEVDEKPTEDYSDIGGLDKQIQELVRETHCREGQETHTIVTAPTGDLGYRGIRGAVG